MVRLPGISAGNERSLQVDKTRLKAENVEDSTALLMHNNEAIQNSPSVKLQLLEPVEFVPFIEFLKIAEKAQNEHHVCTHRCIMSMLLLFFTGNF